MLKMKTLTVGGKTYQLWDPEAARVDDTAVGRDVWSSEKLVEMFCPTVTTQKTAIYPVAGSALQPVTHVTYRQPISNPTPLSPCPITGRNWLTLTQRNGQTAQEYEVALGQYVYCGSVDWTAGVMTLTHRVYTITGEENWSMAGTYGVMCTMINGESVLGDSVQGSSSIHGYSSHAPSSADGKISWDYIRKANNTRGLEIVGFANGRWGADLTQITVAKWKAYVKEQDSMGMPVQVLYRLDQPAAVALTPVQVTALPGENTLTCGEGETTVTYRADPQVLLKKLCIE